VAGAARHALGDQVERALQVREMERRVRLAQQVAVAPLEYGAGEHQASVVFACTAESVNLQLTEQISGIAQLLTPSSSL
jgi:hypothetical protein